MSEKILIVDDEDSLRLSMKVRLQSAGFHVETAGDGEEALEKVKDQPYDVVLLDIKMPHMDGIEALPLILQTSPGTEVIMTTGFADFSAAIECLKAGAKDYLVKPIDHTELVTRLKSLLRTRASEKALQEVEQHYSSILFYDFFGVLDTITKTVDRAMKLSGKEGAKDQKELLTHARDLSEQMVNKIRTMMDLQKVEAASLELHYGSIDVRALVKKVCARQEILAQENKITIAKTVESSLPNLMCDAEKSEQVLDGLLDALIQTSPSGTKITVSVSQTSKTDDARTKEYVLFSIQSNQTRIREEDLNVLFQQDKQSLDGKSEELKETILKLAIAKRIVEAHQGLFWLGPKNGKGMQCNFMLPVSKEA